MADIIITKKIQETLKDLGKIPSNKITHLSYDNKTKFC